MKFAKFLLCILAVSLLATACYAQKPTNGNSRESQSQECMMPLYFDSEEDFLRAINEVNSKANSQGAVVVIPSDMVGEQRYSAEYDYFSLASISEFYRPQEMLSGMLLKEIVVNNYYITYDYAKDNQVDCADFTWFREMTPQEAMNELYGRGAISEREIAYDGVDYVSLEWVDPQTGQSDGYSMHWVVDGKAYRSCIDTGYTDQEMLDFCQFEVVEVPYWPSVDEIATTTISAGTQSVQISKKLDLAAILTFDPEIPDWNVYSLAWVSSNTTLATVNSAGVVTGKSAGMLTVTATLTDPYGGTKSVNFSVKVY